MAAGIPGTLAALERARENCARILLLVQEIELSATPDQASIDQVVSLATNNTLTPKPTYSVDGVSYSWESYTNSLIEQMDKLTSLINRMSAPWEVRSYGI